MKPKGSKKRYKSAEQIMAEIDKAKSKAADALEAAECLEEAVKSLRTAPEKVEEMKLVRARALQIRRRAERLLDKRCKMLSAKLAEIRTPQIPALDNGDGSVAA